LKSIFSRAIPAWLTTTTKKQTDRPIYLYGTPHTLLYMAIFYKAKNEGIKSVLALKKIEENF